jgi:hypothetical protein
MALVAIWYGMDIAVGKLLISGSQVRVLLHPPMIAEIWHWCAPLNRMLTANGIAASLQALPSIPVSAAPNVVAGAIVMQGLRHAT